MEENYVPPYTITDEMMELVSEIMENLGKLHNVETLEKLPRLRRVNRMKTIHSSLAIENNALSLAQVTDVIDGKRVLAARRDIDEVTNAYEAYKRIGEIDPYSVDDMLKIHAIMMKGLLKEAGKIRSQQVGVYNENGEAVHIAPPASFVPQEIKQLFSWVKNSKTNMLIKSSVFHYEFEFIHPFNDGNGRMGRFYQTALLSSWRGIFAWIPVESIIKDNQEDYYKAIASSTKEGKSDIFIVFMLKAIDTAIKDLLVDTKNHYSHSNSRVAALLKVIETYPLSASDLMARLHLKSRLTFRENYLKPAIEAGLVDMTEPDKPTSRNQKYFRK